MRRVRKGLSGDWVIGVANTLIHRPLAVVKHMGGGKDRHGP